MFCGFYKTEQVNDVPRNVFRYGDIFWQSADGKTAVQGSNQGDGDFAGGQDDRMRDFFSFS